MRYKTNDLGDVVATIDAEGNETSVDPTEWGWLNRGGNNDPSEQRRSVQSLRSLPGFEFGELDQFEALEPGPKGRGPWMKWKPGAAPPAAVESDGGTLAYFDRVSEAAAHVVEALPGRDSGAMTIWDFVAGSTQRIVFRAPGEQDPDKARVYLLDDGFGIKVGITWGLVAQRVGALQTGNPRTIEVIAEIGNADANVETAIHDVLADDNVSGEWFRRSAVVERINAAGGVKAWLDTIPAVIGLPLVVHLPYAGMIDA